MSNKWLLLSILPVRCTPTLLYISATPPTSTRAGVSNPSVSFLPMGQLICMFSAPGGYKNVLGGHLESGSEATAISLLAYIIVDLLSHFVVLGSGQSSNCSAFL